MSTCVSMMAGLSFRTLSSSVVTSARLLWVAALKLVSSTPCKEITLERQQLVACLESPNSHPDGSLIMECQSVSMMSLLSLSSIWKSNLSSQMVRRTARDSFSSIKMATYSLRPDVTWSRPLNLIWMESSVRSEIRPVRYWGRNFQSTTLPWLWLSAGLRGPISTCVRW